MTAALPLAAGLDWLEGILPLLFLLFWIVSQVRNLFRGGDRGKPAGPVVVRPAPRPPAVDEAREDLTRQIEEFIRRSTGERPAAPQAVRRRDRSGRPVAGGTAAAPPPARDQRRAARDTRARQADTPPAPTPPSLGSLGGHAADVSRHVRDAFSHEFEHLPPGLSGAVATSPTVTVARSAAADVIAALRDPVTLRQLVIVREVLDRPIDRW